MMSHAPMTCAACGHEHYVDQDPWFLGRVGVCKTCDCQSFEVSK